MTHLAEVVRWLVRCVVAVSSAVILAGPAASAATIPPSSDDATTCDVVSFTDGAPEVALDHADASAHSEAGQSLLGDVLGCSVSPSVEGRAASTTSPRSFIATNTGRQTTILGENMSERVMPFAVATELT